MYTYRDTQGEVRGQLNGSHFFPSVWVQAARLGSKGLYLLSHFISPSVLILQRSKQKISGPNHRLFQCSEIFLSRIKEIQTYVTLQDWFFQLLSLFHVAAPVPTYHRCQGPAYCKLPLGVNGCPPFRLSSVPLLRPHPVVLGKMEESGKRPEALC